MSDLRTWPSDEYESRARPVGDSLDRAQSARLVPMMRSWLCPRFHLDRSSSPRSRFSWHFRKSQMELPKPLSLTLQISVVSWFTPFDSAPFQWCSNIRIDCITLSSPPRCLQIISCGSRLLSSPIVSGRPPIVSWQHYEPGARARVSKLHRVLRVSARAKSPANAWLTYLCSCSSLPLDRELPACASSLILS